jgi:addiction module RelE/StbE family toxin
LQIVETSSFQKAFSKITSKVSPEMKNEFIENIRTFISSPLNPLDFLDDGKLTNKRIQRKFGHVRSFRPHPDYRIIYARDIENDNIIFLTIGHRRDIYKKFSKSI